MFSQFAKNIKALRTKNDMTQRQMAEELNIAVQTVVKWEGGSIEKPRQKEVVNLICAKFNVTEQELFGYADGLYAKIHGPTEAPAGAIAVKPSKPAFRKLNLEKEVGTVFAKNFRAFLERENLRQYEVADKLGVTTTSINGWLNRGIQPRSNVISSIKDTFGLTDDDIFSEQNGLYAKIHGLTEAPAGAIAPSHSKPASRKLSLEEEVRTVFAKNLKALREREEISQYRFAEEMGITQTTVSNWESAGKRPRSQKIIDLICSTYGVSEQELFGYEDGLYAKLHGLTEAPSGAIAVKPSEPAFVPVRVLGKVHAGVLDDEERCNGMAELPASLLESHPRAFALLTTGTCMNRVIAQGEHVFVDPDMLPQQGSIVIVETEAYEAIMRRWYMGSSKLMLSPDSYDEYEDLVFESGEASVKVLGVVFWHQAEKELD